MHDSTGATPSEGAEHHGCPVISIDYRENRPAHWTYASHNHVRELAPITWNVRPRGSGW